MFHRNTKVTCASLVLLAFLILTAWPINAGTVETPSEASAPLTEPAEISLWEAYAKGYSQITSSSTSIAYIISNSGTPDINVDDYILLMSPNPYQNEPENATGTKWAQDGSLTLDSIPSGSTLNYNYGDYVVTNSSLPPPWWCTEDSEFTAPNVAIALTGEIMPFDFWNILANPNGNLVLYDRGDVTTYTSQTQAAVWSYLRQNAACVVGKLPLWKLIPNIPTEVDVNLAVTNLGFQVAGNVVLTDTLPPGYLLKSGSASPAPSTVTTLPDGSTELAWNLGSIRAAIQTADDQPTDYEHKFISYTLKTPYLLPDERYFLPRATVDKDGNGIADAHSEKPLLETYLVNSPPTAVVSPVTVNEGQIALLDGSLSFDIDEISGDYIVSYEWDLNNDGLIDATGTAAYLECPDNGIFPVSLTVTDSYGATDTAVTNVTALNVAPNATVDMQYQLVEVSLRVAGSKWSNVAMTLYEDDLAIGFIEVERWPGSPDKNPTYGGPTIPVMLHSGRTYKAVVTYDPYPDFGDEIKGDQPNNGKDKKDNAGNPVWVVLKKEDGTETKIHHTFNTQQSKIKNSKHWNHADPWEVELNGYIGGLSLTLTAMAYDPGADDLSFTWEFDDGTIITNYYPNPGGVYPVSITDQVDYSGTATKVDVTCKDDDGGVYIVTCYL